MDSPTRDRELDKPFAALETPRDDQGNRLQVEAAHAVDTATSPDGDASASKLDPPASKQLVSMCELFAYADRTDHLLMLFGGIAALASGVAAHIQTVIYGNMLNTFNPSTVMTEPELLRSSISTVALEFIYVAIGDFVCCVIEVACWSISASRQAKRIRAEYVRAILTKEIGWFDVNDPMELSSRVADATVTLQEGMGSKVGDALRLSSVGVSGIIIGFVYGWELTLIMLALTPFIALAGTLSTRVISAATRSGIESYGKAGAIAQESLSNIRTVHMFNATKHFTQKYDDALVASTQAGIKKGFAVGWGTGFMYFTMFCTYACGMFYGAVKVADDQLDGNSCSGRGCYNGRTVIIVFFVIINAAMAMGQAGSCIQSVFSARAAAYDVFQVIKRASRIDPLSDDGKQLDRVAGEIHIRNVSFAYPSRPDVLVCSDYSLTIRAGETVALVGPSGSGKSTVVSLLERFYDPLSGSVKLDGVDVRELNVKWLREQMGLVGQEPSLFATSIMENIRYGAPSATDEQVVEAAKMANAYEFIMEFPGGFATEVGERGAQLSGGQKQRLAIARAIIKNPPILLLDEATSALDSESERVVQGSLDRLLATTKRTTIIVAHRLSTIRNADRIAVHRGGSIVEIGSHDELMSIPDGHYRALVHAQLHSQDSEELHPAESTTVGTPTISVSLGAESQEQRHSSSLLPPSKQHAISKLSLDDADDNDSALVKTEDGSSDSEPQESFAGGYRSIARIWQLSAPEWKFMVMGSIGAVLSAAVYPAWGVMIAKITLLFYDFDLTKHEMVVQARYWSLGFLGIGVVFGVSTLVQNVGFAHVSQKLVTRVRQLTFGAMLRQEIGWFDLDENASGALASRLAADSAILQAVSSDTLNQGLVNATTLGIGFAIAFAYSWQMTLAIIATLPIPLFASLIEAKQMRGTMNKKERNDADTAAGSLLAEAIGSIRTVASFSMEQALNEAYVRFLSVSKRTDVKAGVIAGVGFGVARSTLYINFAFLFWLGGVLVTNGYNSYNDMYMALLVIRVSMLAVGMAAQNKAASARAKEAAKRIFRIIDREPRIDSTSSSGTVLPAVRGDIEFKRLGFRYPSRPDAQIYSDYSLKIAAGQTVALVGASGSGKSTAIALLERFYDPSAGSVTLDGADLRDLSLPWLRERISLVSQEPVLFAGTIAENIAMGKPGATRDDVIDAAKKANAFGFIRNFPQGFDTDVGDRGAQVSGGQKQRIAIARAILRDPEVLLLDEATSALDNESERVVQESLDRLLAAKQRTTIIVAHRLSTIRNANLIAVTSDGAIVEQGTHDELMQLHNGVYRSLVQAQQTKNC